MSARVAVFAPSPIVTVTIERGEQHPEIHVHAGGQGFWVARLAATLGAEVRMCAPIGGESGLVLRALIAAEDVDLVAVETAGANAAYVHDRREGERETIAESPSPALTRHEADELYGAAVTAGLEADVTLLTGPRSDDLLPTEIYRRLAADLRTNGKRVTADLTGPTLEAALEGGLDLLKIAHDSAIGDGLAEGESRAELIAALRRLREAGAENVLLSRREEPALALAGARLVELHGPEFEPLDDRGAGDSMMAAASVALALDWKLEEALRLAVGAGALNVTRRGLGSGRAEDIEALAGHVEVRVLDE